MRKLVKLKQGEAAVLFKNEGVSMVHGGGGESTNITNAACVAFALQHPLFIQIAVQFLADLELLKTKMETEAVH